jgi:hypothetical protein
LTHWPCFPFLCVARRSKYPAFLPPRALIKKKHASPIQQPFTGRGTSFTRLFKDTSAWVLTKDFLEESSGFHRANKSQVTIQGGTKADVYSLYYTIAAEIPIFIPVSTNAAEPTPAFKLTPNPVYENLCFYPSDAYNNWQQIEIWRIDGVKIQSYTPAACLDVAHLPQGMYVLRAVSRSGQPIAIPFVK